MQTKNAKRQHAGSAGRAQWHKHGRQVGNWPDSIFSMVIG
jgi:hypothetical protein